jgi:NAD(P)H-quinone oxidoreductase subunit 5
MLPPHKAAYAARAFAGLSLAAALAAASWMAPITAVLLPLAALLLAVVSHFSLRYLQGDPGQARFSVWLSLTGASVFGIILAPNLLAFALAWASTSLCLHRLLAFYPHRPGALLAARKKFLVSRLGDLCLLGALYLAYAQFGSWNFDAIFAAASAQAAAGGLSWKTHALTLLLAGAALLKSAQFPFHTWLPDTMETPTPVSALMHAGVINAGGILVLRFHPLFTLSEPALLLLTFAGAVTALFASTVMLAQSSVKRCLAFSTVAQMGFLMLECGLGAYHLALVHIVTHSLYKAHAFLGSGGAVAARPAAPLRNVPLAQSVAGLLAAGAVYLLLAPSHSPVLAGIFSLAVAQMLWSLWSQPLLPFRIALSIAAAAVFTAAYLVIDHTAAYIVPAPAATGWPAAAVLAAFAAAALLQSRLPALTAFPAAQNFYVHARDGFYLNVLANRVTRTVWPLPANKEIR